MSKAPPHGSAGPPSSSDQKKRPTDSDSEEDGGNPKRPAREPADPNWKQHTNPNWKQYMQQPNWKQYTKNPVGITEFPGLGGKGGGGEQGLEFVRERWGGGVEVGMGVQGGGGGVDEDGGGGGMKRWWRGGWNPNHREREGPC